MFKKLLSSQLFLLAMVIILSLITWQLVKVTYHKFELERELKPLQAEIQRLEHKKENLAKLFDYFKTDTFIEKEARSKLNLKKEGEQVVIVVPKEGKKQASDKISALKESQAKLEASLPQAEPSSPQDHTQSNPYLWWKYLFNR